MIEEIIAFAKAEVGYTEGKNNDNKFAKIAGHANNLPWCMTFVRAMFVKANAAGYIMNTASCQALEAWATKGNLIVPINETKRGDVLLFDFTKAKKAQHVGIATSNFDPEKKSIHTIEGNTAGENVKGSQVNGDGVYERVRADKFIRAVVRPRWE